ncbi:PLC-like phosphodiesterase [Serendipita vermifera]|nr:PLC-like phosphodiesterase [Serendipita vermifera]
MHSTKRLSVLNLTNDPIVVQLGNPKEPTTQLIASNGIAGVTEFPPVSQLQLTLQCYRKDLDADFGITIRLKCHISRKRKWKAISCPERYWRLYHYEISASHQRILVLPERNLASWMKELPDSLPLSSLCLPGTHETMALYGWPFSQCQDVPISDQFLHGIRMIDIRIVLVDGVLTAYHGVTPEHATFTSILEAICSYLESSEGKSETVIVSIMEESSFMPRSPLFSGLVRDAILSTPSRRSLWFLENRVPKLGEVRGKAIMFSRFGRNGEDWEKGLEGIGIHPTTWPDNRREGFEWILKDTRVRTQDWYGIPSFLDIPEKFEVAVQMLCPKPVPDGKKDLAITFLSASRIPFALPSTVACGFGWASLHLGVEGVNSRAVRWLLTQLDNGGNSGLEAEEEVKRSQITLVTSKDMTPPKSSLNTVPYTPGTVLSGQGVRLRGWVLMDFIRDPPELSLIPLLVECNWRGRVEGEEGWVSKC